MAFTTIKTNEDFRFYLETYPRGTGKTPIAKDAQARS